MSNKPIPLPTKERILALYDFDPKSGIFFHRRLRKIAGTTRPSGHVYLTVDGRRYGAHRIAYFLTHDMDPGGLFVDHINHDPGDNRPENLRLATLAENTRHMKGARVDSSTGVRGVRWREKDKFWYATIGVDRKQIHIGCFKRKEDAVRAVAAARKKYFGEFSGVP